MMRTSPFTPSDRRALLMLTVILSLIIGATWWRTSCRKETRSEKVPIDSAEQVNRFWSDVKKSKKHRQEKVHSVSQPFTFDPNTADSATLQRLGLPFWIAGRICHYRNAGGRFHSAEDLHKIYGLSEADYRRLRPYVHITPQKTVRPTEVSQHDTSIRHYTMKFNKPTKVDVNKADSLTLIRIPGIGPYFAHRIMRYGKLLGGYTDVAQLEEINNFPADALQWFNVGSTSIHKINVNTAAFKEMLRHPYINYEQVKAIMNHRRKFGQLHSLKELSNYETFTTADLQRLSPYVTF